MEPLDKYTEQVANYKYVPDTAIDGNIGFWRRIGGDFKNLWHAGNEDLKDLSLGRRLAIAPVVGLSAIVMALDIPLHETYIAQVGTHAFIDYHENPIVTGLANGIASLGVEAMIATGVTVGINYMPKFTDAIASKLIRKSRKTAELGGLLDKATYDLSYGSGAYVFKRNKLEQNDRNLKRQIGTGFGAVAFLGAFNDSIGTGAASLLGYGERHPDFAPYAFHTVEVLKSPLTWLGFIASRIAIKKYQNHRRSSQQAQDLATNSQNEVPETLGEVIIKEGEV